MQKIAEKIQTAFLLEKDNWILWFPVLFSIGIVVYFALPSEPRLIYALMAVPALIACCFHYKNRQQILLPLVMLLALASGFLAANLRTLWVKAPIFNENNRVKKISGHVDEIQTIIHGKRFIISNLNIEGVEPEATPQKIRIVVNTDDGGANPGDNISLLASLSPPPAATIADGYDFARYAFFSSIGAVGYSVSPTQIVQKSTSAWQNAIAKIRRVIVENILKNTSKTEGNIAVALLVGEQGGIDKKTIENWRVSGIAHILSISGLHLSLAAAIFFFFSRAIFACIPALALKYNVKKWSAYIAIVSSFAYLLLSGSPVPAQRSFIMTSLILIAIIIDRTGTPMRSIALAAMIILIFLPESALDPGFQMSFSSVIALVSCYSWARKFIKSPDDYGFVSRFFMYFMSIVASSLIAGIATAPFTIYHFNNFSSYGILSNLIAIPITSFITMPAGVITLLLMPFGLENLGLFPMCWSIKMISAVAEYIAALPQAIDRLPPLPIASFCLLILGGLWFCLWTTKLRVYAIIPIFIAVIMAFSTKIPDIIIDGSGNLFAVKAENNRLIFSSNKKERYARESWQKKFAQSDINIENQDDIAYLKCDTLGCIYAAKNHQAVFAKHPIALEQDCAGSDILINLTHSPSDCPSAKIRLNIYDLKKYGTYSLYFDGDNIKVTSVSGEKGDRMWNVAVD